MIHDASIQEQVRGYLLADERILNEVLEDPNDEEEEPRVFLTPLKRGDMWDATPEAFSPQPPHMLRVSISLPARTDRSLYTGVRGPLSDRFTGTTFRIAYFAPPTPEGSQIIRALDLYATEVLRGKRVTFADGSGGRIRTAANFIGPVPSQDFPGLGYEAFNTFTVARAQR